MSKLVTHSWHIQAENDYTLTVAAVDGTTVSFTIDAATAILSRAAFDALVALKYDSDLFYSA